MIGDVARTGTYRKAILGNAAVAFAGKTVLDVGAGEFWQWDSSRESRMIRRGMLTPREKQVLESCPICLLKRVPIKSFLLKLPQWLKRLKSFVVPFL